MGRKAKEKRKARIAAKPDSLVSAMTPTYNRSAFIRWTKLFLLEQTYGHQSIEWLVYDDGPEPCYDVIKDYPGLRYIRGEQRATVAAKRNRLMDEATGEYMLFIDDDDFYGPAYVFECVKALSSRSEHSGRLADLSGASLCYYFFPELDRVFKFGPFQPFHSCAGALAFRKSYARAHRFDDTMDFAEESAFTNHFRNPLKQRESFRHNLIICHGTNTVAKDTLLTSPAIRRTDFVAKDFLRDSSHCNALLSFYRESFRLAHSAIASSSYSGRVTAA
jgi:glycosyltransferase involved in cell wall biosynthesis